MTSEQGEPDAEPDAEPDVAAVQATRVSGATWETIHIPQELRDLVDERDHEHCRVCGKYLGEARALHHIRYGGNRTGMGGRREHSLDNLATVCWMWPGNCHDLVHSDKRLWLPLLERTVSAHGLTAMQLRRWSLRGRG